MDGIGNGNYYRLTFFIASTRNYQMINSPITLHKERTVQNILNYRETFSRVTVRIELIFSHA